MVDLALGHLNFERHRVQHMRPHVNVGDHTLDMAQPNAGVRVRACAAAVDPSIAVNAALFDRQHAVTGSERQTVQRMRAHRLAVLVVTPRRFNLGLLLTVD